MCIRVYENTNDNINTNELNYKVFVRSFLNHSSLLESQENYLSCPIGVYLILSILFGSNGARGNSASQIAHALNLGNKKRIDDLSEAMEESKITYDTIVKSLLTVEKTEIESQLVPVINVINAAFIDKRLKLVSSFNQSLLTDFKASQQQIDFTHENEAFTVINEWVNVQTNGLIESFYQKPDDISKATRLALFNIITFKDSWKTTFSPDKTVDDDFSLTESSTIKIPIMSKIDFINYAMFEEERFAMISKPLQTKRFSFVVLLPSKRFDLYYANKFLDGEIKLSDYVDKLNQTSVSLKMPKFSLEKSINLIDISKKMGIIDIFDFEKADLSGISTTTSLFVDLFKQSTVLRVNEHGIEAVSATVIQFLLRAGFQSSVDFHITHPFVCFIYDNLLKIPIFAARVLKPEI